MGLFCYQHHHSSASCQREARTNTAVIWAAVRSPPPAPSKREWPKGNLEIQLLTEFERFDHEARHSSEALWEAMCLAIIIAQWPTNSQEWLTDVINQSPEEIRCNSIRIPPCHLRLLSDRGPHVHSCPHTCYHMPSSNHHVRQQNIKCLARQNWKKKRCHTSHTSFPFLFFLMRLWRHTHFLIWNCHRQKKKKWNQQTDTVSAVCRISFALPPDREMERGTTYRISREWTKEH